MGKAGHDKEERKAVFHSQIVVNPEKSCESCPNPLEE
jgi:hypothetical protein